MVDIDSRSALIALNAAKALPREAVCRLSLLLDRWAEVDDRSRSGESSRQLGVPLRHVEDARRVLEKVGLPCLIRPSFTMGGSGSAIAYNKDEFNLMVRRGLLQDLPVALLSRVLPLKPSVETTARYI